MYSAIKRHAFVYVALWVVIALPAGVAHAVDAGKTSYTAEAVCAFRSIGATDPDTKTRNPDLMAKDFVSPVLNKRFPGMGLAYEDAKIAMDRMDNGVFYYVNARTHHMDAMLKASLASGARQVVILGAGFDSRAYRFHDAYPEVRFFEIDLPATSADKQQRVYRIMGKAPDWVRFVPIDFNTQTLEEVLGKAGFVSDQKTFYVWEGVTYFISQAGVDNTLRFIAQNSAPGSRVVFDYMLEDVVQGADYSPYGARRTVFFVALRGEPYVFGIAPHDLETFVNLRGLDLMSDLGPDDLTQKYLIHTNGTISGKISEFIRIVHAEVPPTDKRRRLSQRAKAQMKSVAPAGKADATTHRVKVPDDVQALFDAYSQAFMAKDFSAVMENYSDNYLSNGRNKQIVGTFIQSMYRDRAVDQHKFVLTRFEQRGARAKIDGFISRKGYRIPLLVQDIVKEADGHWRWYGNQQ